MLKNNKWRLLFSSLVILLPMLLPLIVGNLLPAEIAVHWGLDGTADGFMSAQAIFLVLPLILLVLHWLSLLLLAYSERIARQQNKRIISITFWIIPAISLLASLAMLSAALGYELKVYALLPLILGVTLILIGNYLPKTTRNVTVGIKLPWTLSNDENWNATHRFAGRVFVITGFLMLPVGILPSAIFPIALFALLLAAAFLPMLYSYRFYKRQLAQGLATKEDYRAGDPLKNHRSVKLVSVILAVVLLAVLGVTLFTGEIQATTNEDALTVTASYWTSLTLRYDEIDSVEYREEGVDGHRTVGYASAKLLLGSFQNDELGTYTRYTYTGDLPCIVLKTEKRTIVLGAEDEASVKALYGELLAKISN